MQQRESSEEKANEFREVVIKGLAELKGMLDVQGAEITHIKEKVSASPSREDIRKIVDQILTDKDFVKTNDFDKYFDKFVKEKELVNKSEMIIAIQKEPTKIAKKVGIIIGVFVGGLSLLATVWKSIVAFVGNYLK